MRALCLLLLTVACAAMAQVTPPHHWDFQQPNAPQVVRPAFAFAPGSGEGLPTAPSVCARRTSAELDGGWCVDGLAANASGGSVTMLDAGTGVAMASNICPNGPTCSPRSGLWFDGSASYLQASATSSAGAFTACALVRRDDNSGDGVFVSHYASGAAGAWYVGCDPATAKPMTLFYDNGGTYRTKTHSTAMVPGALHYVCGSTDGTATPVMTICLDGACESSAAQAHPIGAQSARDAVASIAGGGGGKVGTYFGAFMVPWVMDTATIAADAHALLADAPTDRDKTQALVCSRAGAISCPQPYDTEASLSILPANRCCVAGGPAGTGALRHVINFTQSALQTEDFSNAAWSTNGTGGGSLVPTVTANYGYGPTGVKNATRIQFSACVESNGQSAVYNTNPVNPGSPVVQSLWLKKNSGSPSLTLCAYDAGGLTGRCTTITPGSTWRRYSLSSFTYTTGVYFVIGCNNNNVYTGYTNTGAADVLAFGANTTNSAFLLPYAPATASASTVAAEIDYFAANPLSVGASPSPRSWCMGLRAWFLHTTFRDYEQLMNLSVYNTNNSARLGVNSSANPIPRFDTRDGAAATVTAYPATQLTGQTSLALAGCVDAAYATSLWLNGARAYGAASNSITQTGGFYLGNDSGNSFPSDAWMWDVRFMREGVTP